MNKSRLEALSDGVFAIVLTLLVIEIRVPEALEHVTSADLIHELQELVPLFIGYAVTVVVIIMLWISHNFLFSMLVKNVNRAMAGLNILYLALVSLIPFSAHMLGRYTELEIAVALYGLNVLAIGLCAVALFEYALASSEIDTAHNSPRLIKQGRIRQRVTVFFTLLGIASALYVSTSAALVLFMIPVIFNIIPGSLNFVESLFGFDFGKSE